MVHIDNIPHVLSYGFVKKNSPNASAEYIPIGDQAVINVRKSKILNADNSIGSYIPFYFGPRTPMLYVIQHGHNGVSQYEPTDIVYCVILIEDLINNNIDCIFTDGHALNTLTKTYDKNSLSRVNDIISHSDVYAMFWNSHNDLDLKRRKEAELLIKQELPPCFIKGYVVFNQNSKDKLIGFGIDQNKIVIKKNYYF